MRSSSPRFAFVLLVLAACSERGITANPDLGGTTGGPVIGQCSPLEGPCDDVTPCCAGLVCNQLSAYIADSCGEPLPDGSYCLAAAWCRSGVCNDNLCGKPAVCGAADVACEHDFQCCEGLFCYTEGYGGFLCSPKKASGDHCFRSEMCTSQKCKDDFTCL